MLGYGIYMSVMELKHAPKPSLRQKEKKRHQTTLQSNSYEAHPAGKKHRTYTTDYRPTNWSSKILHQQTFQYTLNHNIQATIAKLAEAGIHAQVQVIKFFTGYKNPRSIQVIYAQPPNHNGQVDLMAHGRLGNIGFQMNSAIQSYKEGKAFCLTSYRGVDGNPGTPCHDSNADAVDAALEFLLKLKKYKPKDINFTGASMGSESIINMLYRRIKIFGKTKEKFGKLKLIAPYLSIQDITKHALPRYSILRGKATTQIKPLLWLLRNLLMRTFKDPVFCLKNHLGILPRTVSSVEIYASRNDEYIPFNHTYKLFERIKDKFKEPIYQDKRNDKRVRLYAFEGLTHNQIAAKVISGTKFPTAA